MALTFGLSLGLAAPSLLEQWRAQAPDKEQKITVETLRNEKLMFLVTDRVVTKVVVEQRQHSMLFGERAGYLIATARIYYGIDLERIEENDIVRSGTGVEIRVPRPSVLDFVIAPDAEFVSKRTGLQALRDWLNGRDLEQELRESVRAEAMAFVRSHDLLPDPESILGRVNDFAPALAPASDKRVRFVYEKARPKAS